MPDPSYKEADGGVKLGNKAWANLHWLEIERGLARCLLRHPMTRPPRQERLIQKISQHTSGLPVCLAPSTLPLLATEERLRVGPGTA